jgi:hypothetical protein
MMDSTAAKGWMRKTNFTKQEDDNIQAKARVDAAQHHAHLFIDGDVKGYSQWFPGKKNNDADAHSQDWHHSEHELTKILRSHFPKQMPAHFEILLPLQHDQLMADFHAAVTACKHPITGGTHDDGAQAWRR